VHIDDDQFVDQLVDMKASQNLINNPMENLHLQ
jgi:hypothetical protein